MADVFTRAKRSELMSRIKGKGNASTELLLIQTLKKEGIRNWRRNTILRFSHLNAKITIKPDFVFRQKKIIVFVDGEFWHGHPTKATIPKSNTEFWLGKIEKNKTRDFLQNRILRRHGWLVIRIWQFELKTKAALKKLKKAGLCE